MPLPPYRLIRLLQTAREPSAVLACKSQWLCGTCFECTANCPKGIDVAKVLEGVRLFLLRKNIDALDINAGEFARDLPQVALVAAFRKLTG
jgi:heterodisulfide reductase subunit C